jgi:hypothetical protein
MEGKYHVPWGIYVKTNINPNTEAERVNVETIWEVNGFLYELVSAKLQ